MRNRGNFDHGGEPTSSPGGREFTASETQGPIPALPAARVARSRDTGLNFVGRCQVRCDCEPRGQMASIRAAGMVRRNAFAALKPRPHGRNARHRAPALKTESHAHADPVLAAVACPSSRARSPALAAPEQWEAVNKMAMAITGNVRFSPNRITCQNGKFLAVTPARSLCLAVR